LAVIGRAKIVNPSEIVTHVGENGRKRGESFDARVPRLNIHSVRKLLRGHTCAVLHKAVCLHNLKRHGRRSENLGNESVRVKRNRSD
jgi:hypothetical protein